MQKDKLRKLELGLPQRGKALAAKTDDPSSIPGEGKN